MTKTITFLLCIVNFCVVQAAAYGKCVAATTTGRQELKKDLCAKEFEALRTCFTNAVSDKVSNPPTGLMWSWMVIIEKLLFLLQAKKKAK